MLFLWIDGGRQRSGTTIGDALFFRRLTDFFFAAMAHAPKLPTDSEIMVPLGSEPAHSNIATAICINRFKCGLCFGIK